MCKTSSKTKRECEDMVAASTGQEIILTVSRLIDDLAPVVREYLSAQKIVGIVGRSGTGKSLLAKQILDTSSWVDLSAMHRKTGEKISARDIDIEHYAEGIVLDEISLLVPDSDYHWLLNRSVTAGLKVILISQHLTDLQDYTAGREDVEIVDLNPYFER